MRDPVALLPGVAIAAIPASGGSLPAAVACVQQPRPV